MTITFKLGQVWYTPVTVAWWRALWPLTVHLEACFNDEHRSQMVRLRRRVWPVIDRVVSFDVPPMASTMRLRAISLSKIDNPVATFAQQAFK